MCETKKGEEELRSRRSRTNRRTRLEEILKPVQTALMQVRNGYASMLQYIAPRAVQCFSCMQKTHRTKFKTAVILSSFLQPPNGHRIMTRTGAREQTHARNTRSFLDSRNQWPAMEWDGQASRDAARAIKMHVLEAASSTGMSLTSATPQECHLNRRHCTWQQWTP